MEIFLSISIAEHRQSILPDTNIWLQVFVFLGGEGGFVLKVSSKHIGFRQPKPVGDFKKRDILNEIHQNHKMFWSFFFFLKIT